MVKFAQTVGFTKLSQNPTRLEIQHHDQNLRPTEKEVVIFNHVATFGFSSKRARVTVLLQRTDDGSNDVHVMSKGQDTVMMSLIEDSTVAPSVDDLTKVGWFPLSFLAF